MTLQTKQVVLKRLGEFLREAAVLVLVFALLDRYMFKEEHEVIPFTYPLLVFLGSMALLASGIFVGIASGEDTNG
jgi:hypothetical protein